ncbi:MAG: hypothetical protein E6G30_06385 [Actinobacteria bacterium]|nr:MAG: hypothetical protein E6G30_06385 [Actinomycetota bacterium]
MRPPRRAPGLALLAALAAGLLLAWPAAGASAVTPGRSALLVFVPAPAVPPAHAGQADLLLRALAARPVLDVGLMSATQGNYSPEQELLDITQGIRVSPTAYRPPLPGPLSLVPAGAGGRIAGWAADVRRARRAPATIRPGLLASSIPGRAAYVGSDAASGLDAAAAADRHGRVALVSRGPPATVVARTRAALASSHFVVVDLPGPRTRALAELDALLAARAPRELLIATQAPPAGHVLQFLPIGVAGSGRGARGVTSDTTQWDGVVAGIDVLPTVLRHLGVSGPSNVTGARIHGAARVSASDLEHLRGRYSHIAPRRIRTLEALLAAWAALLVGFGLAGRLRAGMRIGALALLWLPVTVLLPGAIDPARTAVEAALVAGPAFVLGALTDRFVPWPRAPIVPALVTLVVYFVDLAAGSNLITLSLLGPNPRAGARFYGIGNELEPALPILLFVGLAALMTGRERTRRQALAFALSGLVLALAVGSGLLGADVGGVVTCSVGAAVATVLMLPGGVPRRIAAALFVVVPVLAVGALALLDLVTGANSHFARNVLEAHGSLNVWQTIERRYQFAWHALRRGRMPEAFALCALAVAVAVVYRDRLYARLPGPAWRATLVGGLWAGIAGALSNDSGPLLFVVAVFVLGVVSIYLYGAPRTAAGVATLGTSAASAPSPGAEQAGAEVPAGVSAGEVVKPHSP